MGRYSTGSVTTLEAHRINLSYLQKNGYIKNGSKLIRSLNWTDGSSIRIKSELTHLHSYVQLDYTLTDRTGQKTPYNYRILLTKVPSNLGKGFIHYFICPASGERCRILYKCYGSHIWKARTAYHNRIYYESQLEPKKYRWLAKYYSLDRQIEVIYKRGFKKTYQDKPTRIARRLERLSSKLDMYPTPNWNELLMKKCTNGLI